MTVGNDDFVQALNDLRRTLCMNEKSRLPEALRRLSATSEGHDAIVELERTVNAFGTLAPRLRNRFDRQSGLRYDGGPLFSNDASVYSKLAITLDHHIAALRLEQKPQDGRLQPSEWDFWNTLDGAGLRLPFVQYPIGYYRADFAYPEWALVIEVDGPVHDREWDQIRDRYFRQEGWLTYRVSSARISGMSYARRADYLAGLFELLASRDRLDSNTQVVLDSRNFAVYRDTTIEQEPPKPPWEEFVIEPEYERHADPFLITAAYDLDPELDDDLSSIFRQPDS